MTWSWNSAATACTPISGCARYALTARKCCSTASRSISGWCWTRGCTRTASTPRRTKRRWSKISKSRLPRALTARGCTRRFLSRCSSITPTAWGTSCGASFPVGGWITPSTNPSSPSHPNGQKKSRAISTTPPSSAGARSMKRGISTTAHSVMP